MPIPRELGDQSSMVRSRSVSVSSDAARISLSTPPPVDPTPAFIAASSASQIITVDMEQNEIELNNSDGVSISANSLMLLNGFLDYMLFSFLASAKSTQLSELRPAIAEVLKPRLASEVIATADEELGEYMGGNDEDEVQEFRGGRAPHGEFDLVRAWKLARLRCMVYTRLGDLEEEEEDEHIAREGLDEAGGSPRRFSSHAGNITPAAAIFLTSIIENLGELSLVIAAENARNRMLSGARSSPKSPSSTDGVDKKMIVDETDMEKLALNKTLGRLWRTWKKGIRTPTLARALSRESFIRRSTSHHKLSASISEDLNGRESRIDHSIEEERPKSVDPADIALPMNDDDVMEIENGGLWIDVEEAQTMQASIAQKVRPRSLIVSRSGAVTPTSPKRYPGTWPATNSPYHTRSHSVPVRIDILKPYDQNTLCESRSPLESVTETEANEGIIIDEATLANGESKETSNSIKAEESDVPAEQIRTESIVTAQQVASVEANTIVNDQVHPPSGDEIVEGQGTYQKPNLNNLSSQRPRRKASKETSKKDILPASTVNNQAIPASYRDDRQSIMQGGAVKHDTSSPTRYNGSYAADPFRPHGYIEKPQHSSHGSAPTSYPRQLETNPEASIEENVEESQRNSLNPSRHSSSIYAESIGAPHSTSDDSEGSVYRSIPSRAASHTTSTRSQSRQDEVSIARDRVTVQRVYGGSSTSQASIRSRRSGSISDKRPLTSGSATSNVSTKLKGLIGRHPADADVPLPAPPRRSSDASKFVTNDTDETTLDQLIKSDETIRFTLTPRAMREIELPKSPRWNTARNEIHHDRTNTSDLADFLKNTAPPGEAHRSPHSPIEKDIPTPRVKNVLPGVDGLRVQEGETNSGKSSPVSVRGPVTPVSQISSRSKAAMHQAREPQSSGDSVREFAQFIRSTGPAPGSGAVAAPSTDANSRPQGNGHRHFRHGSGSVASLASRPNTAQSASSRTTARPRESSSSARKNGSRLQARDASGHGGSKTSDLIDFIREGPPGASTHRIPRTVAPFRNTMDSEDLLLMETARDNDTRMAPSLASTGAESVVSSHGPLLAKSSNLSGASPMPARKRRGPKDPYAIDFSDDEDMEDSPVSTNGYKAPPRAEESMLDFLNSAPPPISQKAPEPFILTSHPTYSRASPEQPASSSKGRGRRNTFMEKIPGPTLKKSMSSMRSAKLSSSKTQISSPVPQSFGQPPVPALPKINISPSSHPNFGYKSAFESQPRSTRQTETGALADFLKNTAPPEPIQRAPSAQSVDKKDSPFSKYFRRKRVEA